MPRTTGAGEGGRAVVLRVAAGAPHALRDATGNAPLPGFRRPNLPIRGKIEKDPQEVLTE
ncbi:hypothetical protein [Streptosporangium subroseum]|uniref:hypothetical protein n=1 Tax=Streptosporangium subroseum TaxID=106412 RepID=UPI00308DBE23|nr:hypothetical protein OHB15_16635 [Streptosporangium subroseum]